jgi:hypothetical protein
MLHRQAPLQGAYGSTAVRRFSQNSPIKKPPEFRRFESLAMRPPLVDRGGWCSAVNAVVDSIETFIEGD